jgi:hypothetical protein
MLRRAFPLLELLVAVAILAAVPTLMIPVAEHETRFPCFPRAVCIRMAHKPVGPACRAGPRRHRSRSASGTYRRRLIRKPLKEDFMKAVLYGTMAVLISCAPGAVSPRSQEPAHGAKVGKPEAVFKNYQDLKWDKILPGLGASSPELCILHVDPKTKATKLLNRTPKGIHIRKHWHSANETHTMIVGTAEFACDGRRVEQGPGSFNSLPAKMVHEAWPSAGSVAFITVDGPWDVYWVEGAPTAADLIK